MIASPTSVRIGGREHQLSASPRALLVYNRYTGRDLLTDVSGLAVLYATDSLSINTLDVLEMVWALAKTDAGQSPFPEFDEWLESLDGTIGTEMGRWVGEVAVFTANAFFREAEGAAEADAHEGVDQE